MLKNLELAVGTTTYIPEIEGIVPFHECNLDEDAKELDAIIITVDNDANTIQELKAFQKTLPAYGLNQQTYEWFLQNIHSKIEFPFELPAVENLSSTGKNKILAKQLYYAIEEMNQSLLQKMKTKIVEWWKKFLNLLKKIVEYFKNSYVSKLLIRKCEELRKFTQSKIAIESFQPNDNLPEKIVPLNTQYAVLTDLSKLLEIFASILKGGTPEEVVNSFSERVDVNNTLFRLNRYTKQLSSTLTEISVSELVANNNSKKYDKLANDFDSKIGMPWGEVWYNFKNINIDKIINDLQYQGFKEHYETNYNAIHQCVLAMSRACKDLETTFKPLINNMNAYIKENQ